MAKDENVNVELLHTVIEDKQQRVEQVVAPKIEKLDARQEAYQKIVNIMKADIEAYLIAHPERATDQRSKDAEQASLAGLKKIFNILDEYMILFKPEH
jgi:hypothetical protein